MNEMKLLIVDDDHFSLRLISEHLSRQGFAHVTGVLGAAQALELLHRPDRQPDVILCDLNMPDVDGIQFIEALGKTMWDGSLILLTGENSRLLDAATQLARTLGIHVVGTLGKPIDPKLLRELLDQYEPRSYPYVESARNEDGYAAGELADAIEQGQLVLHYQPQVRVSDGVPTSIECLVRWRHPQDGLVYPDQFIPLAEENELIDALTECVVRLAMDQTRSWRESGIHLPVAINLSMNTLQREDAVDAVHEIVEIDRPDRDRRADESSGEHDDDEPGRASTGDRERQQRRGEGPERRGAVHRQAFGGRKTAVIIDPADQRDADDGRHEPPEGGRSRPCGAGGNRWNQAARDDRDDEADRPPPPARRAAAVVVGRAHGCPSRATPPGVARVTVGTPGCGSRGRPVSER